MNITINADTISIVSACIALGSMVAAVSGAIISSKNLKLQKDIYNESKPNFKMQDVLESYVIYDDSRNIVKFMFYPLIINTSTKTLILEKIRLQLVGEDNKNIILRPVINDKYINDGHSVSGNSADTNWICFELDKNAYKDIRIIKHKLSIEDTFNNTQTVSMTWLKEMMDEYGNEN